MRQVAITLCQVFVTLTCVSLTSVTNRSARAESVSKDPNDWSMYNYDLTGSRYNRGEKQLGPNNASQLIEKWRFPAKDSDLKIGVIHATPTVVNGHVYFGTATHASFYKLAPNGEVKWTYPIAKGQGAIGRLLLPRRLTPADGVYSSALVTDVAVYFADAKGIVYSLGRATGGLRWKVDSRADDFPGAHPANVFLSSPIFADGKIIIGGGAYEHATAAIPGYKCCRGRGCLVALDPDSGDLLWKYDVGPEPEEFDPPLKMELYGVERTYHYGPSTSSVWSTPSYDEATGTLYFGTDVHNSPRRPTEDNPRRYTRHSAAVVALNVRDGSEKWLTQITSDDVWNHTLPAYDPKTGKYKDQSIGDTPKLYTIDVEGRDTKVVGVGSKNGGFYVLRADNGQIVANTPLYLGPPKGNPKTDARTLALPSAIGGLQTGCATDGESVYTNGIDALRRLPSGGRVSSISLDTADERWRHNRPLVPKVPRTDGKPAFTNVGDPVASGIAVANRMLCFTTLVSNKLVLLDTSEGQLLKEFELGPVFSGPSISRGRVYVGTGNTLFSPTPAEDFFPKRYTGTLYSYGLPGEDDIEGMGAGDE